MDLREKVRNLPSSPGVYLMRDSMGNVIYVGKSKSLKNRVQSYFHNSKAHSPKVEKLVKTLKDFDYILTDTEFEAFMLECKLIKGLKPFYNSKMKSPMSYTYLEIKMGEEYPGIEIANNPGENSSSLYFGPYTSKNTVERAIQGIKECCRIMCSSPSNKNSTCLNYSLGLCMGMCLGDSVVEEYHRIINKIIALLNGTDMGILAEMEKRMMSASERFDFETAAKYRDYIGAVSSLVNKEDVIGFTEENKNIVIIEPLGCSVVKLFLVKRNKILFSRKYNLDTTEPERLLSVINKRVLACFKAKELDSAAEVTKDEIDEAQIVYSYLKTSTCGYTVIPDKWLEQEYSAQMEDALKKLLFPRTL